VTSKKLGCSSCAYPSLLIFQIDPKANKAGLWATVGQLPFSLRLKLAVELSQTPQLDTLRS
jgi:hypothetical protein